MAKKRINAGSIKTKKFSLHFFARVLVRCINTLLPTGERCCIQKEVNEDNPRISRRSIALVVSQWKKSAKDSLWRQAKKHQYHWLASMMQSPAITPFYQSGHTLSLKRVLPTEDEICRRVDSIFAAYRAQVFSCQTQSDLTEAISFLDSAYDALNNEVVDRVHAFNGYVAKSGRSIQFVGEAISLRDVMREFMALPIRHEVSSERLLLQTLLDVIDAWGTFCKKKNASDLIVFYEGINSTKKVIDALKDRAFSKTKEGKSVDLKSFIAGFQTKKYDDPIM